MSLLTSLTKLTALQTLLTTLVGSGTGSIINSLINTNTNIASYNALNIQNNLLTDIDTLSTNVNALVSYIASVDTLNTTATSTIIGAGNMTTDYNNASTSYNAMVAATNSNGAATDYAILKTNIDSLATSLGENLITAPVRSFENVMGYFDSLVHI